MPATTRQYTDCYDVINGALLRAANTVGAPGGARGTVSAGSLLPTPVIVILAVLALLGVLCASLTIRRRRS